MATTYIQDFIEQLSKETQETQNTVVVEIIRSLEEKRLKEVEELSKKISGIKNASNKLSDTLTDTRRTFTR